ncbi:hypothetical protein [Kribbella deserti]|uniref:Uncharacterized protein n=1 Tax=Kribbella deserti TaxID=1926257 RepID=A0ABV6QSX0_9ACTN
MTTYSRYQSPEPNEDGRHIGIFGLVNGLAKQGRLTPEQEAFRRTNNDWYDAAYQNPSLIDPTVYDRAISPLAAAWFKPSAHHLFDRIPGYLNILATHNIPCTLVTSTNPGRIIYEDANQIVVVPPS